MNSKKRREIIRKQFSDDPSCRYCKAILGEHEATLDHKIPRSMGGTNEASNLLLSCRQCNKKKSDLMPWEYGV